MSWIIEKPIRFWKPYRFKLLLNHKKKIISCNCRSDIQILQIQKILEYNLATYLESKIKGNCKFRIY